MQSFGIALDNKTRIMGWEQENHREIFHNGTPLLDDAWKPWKPHQRSRAFVKGCMLQVRCALAVVGGIEWYGYAALGIVTATISFLMDLSVAKLLTAHQMLYMHLEGSVLLQFLCWSLYPVALCALSAAFSHSICPFSTGSGVPEVRTILAGIGMPHYLSLTNLFAKVLGLTCTLASGSTVFLGKVGPFVHLSTMVGAYLSQLCTLIKGEKEGGAEMLTVAAAVGVASCFGAPVSGVLFGVEVMCSHFAVRDYCPCFFSTVCGALTFRLFSVWSGERETLQPLFQTHFPNTVPFYPLEIVVFASLGLLCGAVSCVYLFLHRWILRLAKTNQILVKMLTTEKALYSAIVVFLLASLTFPHSAGQYMASKYTLKQLLTSLLDSRQWGCQSHNASLQMALEPWTEWSSTGCPLYLSLAIFLCMKMWMLVLACSLPIPAGYFMPVFIYGAALGRLVGEGLACWLSSSGLDWTINPGGYALAGAAAFSGAVTHTLSPALLVIEVSGQFTHAAPVLLTTLLANAVARSQRRPSFYDALSLIKKLPHLPSLLNACPRLSSVQIGHVLTPVRAVLYKSAGPMEVQQVIDASSEIEIPVVDSLDSQILLGCFHRSDLLMYLHQCKNEALGKCVEDACLIHPTSVQLSTCNTVQEAHGILSMLGSKTLYVTERGKLAGFITWPEMKRILEDFAKEI